MLPGGAARSASFIAGGLSEGGGGDRAIGEGRRQSRYRAHSTLLPVVAL